MKISLITVTYNSEEFLEGCIQSVINQSYSNIEYIIVDGNSTDSTPAIIEKYRSFISKYISEPDLGIYDAMNKGINMASGEIIGVLNGDDYFADNGVLSDISEEFNKSGADIVYGNLWYVSRNDPAKIIRKWISKSFNRNSMKYGWMPAHPTFYARKKLFARYGNYDLLYQSAADYELMLRFLFKHNQKSSFLNRVFVKMRTGGLSNKSLKNRINASLNDRRAMKKNGISFSWLFFILKPIRKIEQFINHN
ncbi:glycosyltransferase family 2 protein [Daejeonella oryzae]|uniref:glycosyltransferase family 2 protein n=1 Tax=Daejeonella oryzae TaxID=1122943 RepID=UPI0004076999|nr:glycosyltransferase family 2 protein [Daejeonella oryzae]